MYEPVLEHQLAWHVKVGDMIALWVGDQNKDPAWRRQMYLCYSIHKSVDRQTKWVRIKVLGWTTTDDVFLEWDEPVELITMPSR